MPRRFARGVHAAAVLVVATGWMAGGAWGADTPAAASTNDAFVSDPAALVNPFAGTGTGSVSPGAVSEYPGADVPFGMIQWSPDTWPDRISGSGYSWSDSHISGFSLTHLSGTGCSSYGDIPILPTVGAIGSHPASTTASFSHAQETASPGRYAVTLGPAGIRVSLAATTRSGIARLHFPSTAAANVLFKTASSANGVSAARINIMGNREVTGQATSGKFCDTGTNYTVYFAAQFNRPFGAAGVWNKQAVQHGRACAGFDCGGFVTFNTGHDRTVLMKVAISFVSTQNAHNNLAVEDPGWSVARVASAAHANWNTLLSRIRVGGGTPAEQRTFYTALYHSMLHPNVVSDENGQYTGTDAMVHSSAREQYANFSEWDIYRSEIELIALMSPTRASAMVQSLLNAQAQDGWLPKWAIVGGDASQMNGDSADPIIAAAYGFGARDFDVPSALQAMVKGATQTEPPQGLEIERQYLDQYLSQHYVTGSSLDLTSIDYSIGSSVTLEYAIDDFAVAQIARSQGDNSLYQSMMQRAHNWQYLFNPATGYIQARNADGSFSPGPAFQRSQLEPGGQLGFEEGNSIQYTWSVPQDLSALANLMGGDHAAVAKLNTFFTRLNAGRDEPYDWAGNEPNLWTAWEYDYFGAPWRTQEVVRQIVNTLYADRPVDEPGNDDLGALSSWYVWAALGLYPVTPGTANLALASPLFPRINVALADGKTLAIRAPAAAAADPYLHSVHVDDASPVTPQACAGAPEAARAGSWNAPWLPASILRTGGTILDALSSMPDRTWGTARTAAPPSFGTGRLPAVGYSSPSGAMTVKVGRPVRIRIASQGAEAGAPSVLWSLGTTPGLSASPMTGSLGGTAAARALPTTACATPPPRTDPVTINAASAGTYDLRVSMVTATGTALPPVVLKITATN